MSEFFACGCVFEGFEHRAELCAACTRKEVEDRVDATVYTAVSLAVCYYFEIAGLECFGFFDADDFACFDTVDS